MIYYSKVKVKLFAFRAIDRLEVCVALTFDLKVILAILSLHFNQHIICNYCAIYKHTSSMHERGVCITSSVTDFKIIFDFDLKVISIFLDFCCNLHICCSKYEYA